MARSEGARRLAERKQFLAQLRVQNDALADVLDELAACEACGLPIRAEGPCSSPEDHSYSWPDGVPLTEHERVWCATIGPRLRACSTRLRIDSCSTGCSCAVYGWCCNNPLCWRRQRKIAASRVSSASDVWWNAAAFLPRESDAGEAMGWRFITLSPRPPELERRVCRRCTGRAERLADAEGRRVRLRCEHICRVCRRDVAGPKMWCPGQEHYPWKPDRECPSCRGRGFMRAPADLGDSPTFELPMCHACRGLGFVELTPRHLGLVGHPGACKACRDAGRARAELVLPDYMERAAMRCHHEDPFTRAIDRCVELRWAFIEWLVEYFSLQAGWFAVELSPRGHVHLHGVVYSTYVPHERVRHWFRSQTCTLVGCPHPADDRCGPCKAVKRACPHPRHGKPRCNGSWAVDLQRIETESDLVEAFKYAVSYGDKSSRGLAGAAELGVEGFDRAPPRELVRALLVLWRRKRVESYGLARKLATPRARRALVEAGLELAPGLLDMPVRDYCATCGEVRSQVAVGYTEATGARRRLVWLQTRAVGLPTAQPALPLPNNLQVLLEEIR